MIAAFKTCGPSKKSRDSNENSFESSFHNVLAAPAHAGARSVGARIRESVARNARLVLSDEKDLMGVKTRFDPEHAQGTGDWMLNAAGKRRAGEWAV